MQIKGALHVHSEFSYDAKLALSELKTLLKKEGLSFVLMTEHTDELTKDSATAFVNACRDGSDSTFIFVPGFEVPYKNTHVLMIGADEFFEGGEADVLRRFKEKSARSVLAHPHRNNFQVDSTLVEVIDGIEIWNSQYDGKYVARNKSLQFFKRLAKGKSMHAFAGWDFHRTEHSGGPTLSVSVTHFNEASILAAVASGRFTTEGRRDALRSDGTYLRGGGAFSTICSVLSVAVVTLGKKVNKFLARIGIRLPRSFRRIIRKVI